MPTEATIAEPTLPLKPAAKPRLTVAPQAAAKRPAQRVSLLTDDRKLVETVVSTSGVFQFLVEGQTQPVGHIQKAGERIEPPHNLRRMLEVVRFPSGVAPYGSTAELLEEIQAFLRRYQDIASEWLPIISLYVLMTWVYDRFTAVPYLRFLGEPGTGKTRLLHSTSAISYKGTMVSGNITGAALFRTIDMMRGTMAVDEGDFKNSAEWSDITKILNTGYTTGTPIIRCDKSDDFIPEAFCVFGPKIISTRKRFQDEATETRCLTLETKECKVSEHIPLQLPLSFDEEARALRNKLLQWRFDHFHATFAREEELRSLVARTGQIGASLMAVAPDNEWRKKVVEFLGRSDAGRKEESPKGLVQQAIARMRDEGEKSATVGAIAFQTRSLANELGVDELSAKTVGGILKSLGIEKRRVKVGYLVDLVAAGERCG